MAYLPQPPAFESFGSAGNLAAALNSSVIYVNTYGYAQVSIEITMPAGSPTLTFMASYDEGTSYVDTLMTNQSNGAVAVTTTTGNTFIGSIAGASHFKVVVSVAGSGAAGTIRGRAITQAATIQGTAQPMLIAASHENGELSRIPATSLNHLEIAVHEPSGAFGDLITASLTPRVQIDAIYGILATDVETFTDGVTGAVSVASGQFVCTTGTGVGAYAVIRSRRIARYRPGQGLRIRFTARFDAGVANSLLVAGAFNSEDALYVGYSGTTFGFMRRIAGAAAIYRLTVTVGSGGAETVTITLNSVPFTLATGGILTTTALAEAIAERVSPYTGWASAVSPTSNGATVTFIQGTPAVVAGTFTMTSTGTAAGTFAVVQAGAANDSATGFVAQTAWNIDRMDGSRGPLNPSARLLDPSKLNIYEIIYGYLGAAHIQLRVMSQEGEFNAVHTIEYPNSNTITNQRNPTFRIGWVAASLGSSTDLNVYGTSAAMFTEGLLGTARDPFSAKNGAYAAGTVEYAALCLRVRGEFTGRLSQREVAMANLFVGLESANRLAVVRVVLNPTLTGAVTWAYVAQATSVMEYATPTTIPVTGGSEVAAFLAGSSSSTPLDLSALDLRLEPGDVLVIALATVTSTSTAVVSANWQER